jgi:hypothetical protein
VGDSADGGLLKQALKDGFDVAVRSFGEVNKGLQAITAEVTGYSKKAFEEGTRAFEQLMGAKSVEQAIEIQSRYAKKAYDTYIVEARRDVSWPKPGPSSQLGQEDGLTSRDTLPSLL